LAQTWQDVANIRIRCKGTIGGNIMAADPNYDFALAAMAAGAHLDFLGQDGTIRGFSAMELVGLGAYGLLTGITFPSAGRLRLVFDRSLRPAITLTLGLDLEDGKVIGGRVAVGCAFPVPIASHLPISEPLPPREMVESAAILARDLAASLPEPVTNHHASARYRRRMTELLLRRNLARSRSGLHDRGYRHYRYRQPAHISPECTAEPDRRGFAARGSAAHRLQDRLRPGGLWRLHSAGRRSADDRLYDFRL
jgi:carbon-monoxide dehydrogenase medium subunit